MDKNNKNETGRNVSPIEETALSAAKQKTRGRKRKRQDSETSSTDMDDILPNMLEIEKNLHASAIKNNLDDVSVKKILRKVVTNDHVLALVKLREEEESALPKEKRNLHAKITRAKAKELMRASPNSAQWNLELTPIKQIPVKTRPEVKALITKELPEDEDDEEYKPNNDDVPSDDDQTLESCSDIESQPRTPATPRAASSPQVITDGPFKVPQGIATPARRKLIIDEEEATIALRTRSKLSLSATPIEHIESSFVPPDEVPIPVDEIWNEFIEECLNPAEVSKNEEDDDADPEYNVAADPDANDEDEEALERALIKISKKELNDLVTELFSIMPEDNVQLAESLASKMFTGKPTVEIPSKWEGKQEPLSDEDIQNAKPQRISVEKRDSAIRYSIGKSEPEDYDNLGGQSERVKRNGKEMVTSTPVRILPKAPKTVNICVEEIAVRVRPSHGAASPPPPAPPAPLRALCPHTREEANVVVTIDTDLKIQPEQLLIIEQQLRQHIQLAASNFLQLFVNPAHWSLAPTYKDYLMQLHKMWETNPKSIVNVCNLKPAVELVQSWESTVSEDTPENKKLVEFIQKEAERSRVRFSQNSLYIGDFPNVIMETIANSPVFLYPYLLPAMPYRADNCKKFSYRRTEDKLIVLGLDQFWRFVEDNPDLYKVIRRPTKHRWGLLKAAGLVCKYMMPWLTPRLLLSHIRRVRMDKDNPIHKFFKTGEVTPVEHKLLPFNPKLTLYEHPEHEMPRIWVRYLAKNSKRFRDHIYKRKHSGLPPNGVLIETNVKQPIKPALPINYLPPRNNLDKEKDYIDRQDINIVKNVLPAVIIGNASPITNESQNINLSGNVTLDNVYKTVSTNTDLEGKVNSIPVIQSIYVNNVVSPIPNIVETISNENVPENNNVNKNLLTPLMFNLVQTSVGSFLVPMNTTQTTNTVNSINTPISSTKDTSDEQPNIILQEILNSKQIENHCQCCILLRRISKRQTRITDFFKRSSENKKCECTERKYPKVTRRLKLLVKIYKSSCLWEFNRLQESLKFAKENIDANNKTYEEHHESFDLEDIEHVTSYVTKVMTTPAYAQNFVAKKKFRSLFECFDPYTGDAVQLYHNVYELMNNDPVATEFLAFLSPLQADQLRKFKDYFVTCCLKPVLKMIEEKVKDRDKKIAILSHLIAICTDSKSTSCCVCAGILVHLLDFPEVAEYVFSLFPHRAQDAVEKERIHQRVAESIQTDKQNSGLVNQESMIHGEQQSNPDGTMTNVNDNCEGSDDGNETITVVEDHNAVDHEDNNSTDEDRKRYAEKPSRQKLRTISQDVENETATQNEYDEVEITISKTEVQESFDRSNLSPELMSEDADDTPVKLEIQEWKREEDKLILELLFQHLTPQERKDKTILEILQEKNVYQTINERLPHKSIGEVKSRVLCLLEILVLREY